MKEEILYCDNHLLIAVKPAGMSTQPHEMDRSRNLTDEMKAVIKRRFNKPGRVFLEPIHRLDNAVSGIVVFARTTKALSRLNEMMREGTIRKTYLGWVEGTELKDQGRLEHFLVHEERRAAVVPPSDPDGKKAQLLYKVLDRKGGLSLVEIELLTGRYHQIRAQFGAIHHPIVGDRKYGAVRPWKCEGIALHHYRLQCQHPTLKDPLEWRSLPLWIDSKQEGLL